MKTLTATLMGAAALCVAACSSSSTSVPRDQTNVCNILEDREDWGEALADAEHKWGAPPHVVMAISWKESSFRHHAKTNSVTSSFLILLHFNFFYLTFLTKKLFFFF